MAYKRNDQPEIAEYMELLIPLYVYDKKEHAGAIEFRFSQYTNSRGYTYPIPGLRTEQKSLYMIKTNSELPFKSGDIIRFSKDDKRRYTITKVDYDNVNMSKADRRLAYLYPNSVEKLQYKIITLE